MPWRRTLSARAGSTENADIRVCPGDQRRDERDAILVIDAVRIVAVRVGSRLAVRFGVQVPTEDQCRVEYHHVARAVIGEQRLYSGSGASPKSKPTSTVKLNT